MEADKAVERAEEAEAKNKKYEHLLLEKEQEITSLQHKISVLDGDLEKAETKLTDLKSAQEDGEQSKTANEGLQRKIQLLEEELDAADKNLKEAMDKYVSPHAFDPARMTLIPASARLRQVDVKAEHFERQVTRLEQERDQWEKKYEVCNIILYAYITFYVHIGWHTRPTPTLPLANAYSRLQEANDKYRESKRELDELVANMQHL